MEYQVKNEMGKVGIDESVFQMIAGMAVAECYGVIGMAARKASESIIDLFKKENLGKGVAVRIDGEEVSVDLHIVVGYGTKINAVASSVMETVKYKMESLIGVTVKAVNVIVSGVRV